MANVPYYECVCVWGQLLVCTYVYVCVCEAEIMPVVYAKTCCWPVTVYVTWFVSFSMTVSSGASHGLCVITGESCKARGERG